VLSESVDEADLPGGEPLDDFSGLFVGLETRVPLLGGGERRYVNFDNAATTPALRGVAEAVNDLLPWYASVHRGTGYKSLLTTQVYEQCRSVVAGFFGADLDDHIVLFAGNSTDAVNKISRRLSLREGQFVVVTLMEHHSNLLPWRQRGEVRYVRVHPRSGVPDLDHLEEILRANPGRVPLVAVSGASNISGCVPPVCEIARLAHRHGAQLLVDAAQLAAHRPIRMGRLGDEDAVDFLVCSAHKIYAPYGVGVLIGPRAFFRDGPPAAPGGGTVALVTRDDVIWAEAPELEEAGSPNVLGAVAVARALRILGSIGMERIARHERTLTRLLLRRLCALDGVRVFGPCLYGGRYDRVGVVPFLVDGLPHALVAAALGYEWGIGVRHGCFCAHPYIIELLEVGRDRLADLQRRVLSGDGTGHPGFTRASLALYNTVDEVEHLVEALATIIRDGPWGTYRELRATGEFVPDGFEPEFEQRFRL